MIQVEEPPDVRACSTCMLPLTWIYVHHLRRNIAVVPVRDVDRWTFRIHTCELKPAHTWRSVQIQHPETARRGARRAKAVLDEKKRRRHDDVAA